MRLLATGAWGVVGRRLVSVLASKTGMDVAAVARRDSSGRLEFVAINPMSELSSSVVSVDNAL